MAGTKETNHERDEVLRRMLKTPPKPHKPISKQPKKKTTAKSSGGKPG
jgi:hypothetical protein